MINTWAGVTGKAECCRSIHTDGPRVELPPEEPAVILHQDMDLDLALEGGADEDDEYLLS